MAGAGGTSSAADEVAGTALRLLHQLTAVDAGAEAAARASPPLVPPPPSLPTHTDTPRSAHLSGNSFVESFKEEYKGPTSSLHSIPALGLHV